VPSVLPNRSCSGWGGNYSLAAFRKPGAAETAKKKVIFSGLFPVFEREFA